MRSRLRSGYLRRGTWGTLPSEAPTEYVPRTEHEETRRMARDWLRERGDDDAIHFEDLPDFG